MAERNKHWGYIHREYLDVEEKERNIDWYMLGNGDILFNSIFNEAIGERIREWIGNESSDDDQLIR